MRDVKSLLTTIPKKTNEVCKIHGIHKIKSGDLVYCVKCFLENTAEEDRKRVRLAQKRNIQSVLRGGSLVDDVSDYNHTFSNFKAPKGTLEANIGNLAYKIAKEYIETGPQDKVVNGKHIRVPGKPMTTFFGGPPGQGKTHLAMSMLNMINQTGTQRCRFVDINSLFYKVQNSIKDSTEKWNRVQALQRLGQPSRENQYEGTDVLVIDDLGSEAFMRSDSSGASEFKQQLLKEILDRQKRIIVTTNLSRTDLERAYNPKLVSRLLSHSNGRRVDFSKIKDKRLSM